MLLRVGIGLALLMGPQVFAKSFGEYCLSPDNDAQIHTIHRMLRAVGLPAERTPTICAAGQSALQGVEALTFKYIVVKVPHSFESKVIEPITDLRPLESLIQLKRLSLFGPTIKEAFVHHNPLATLQYLEDLKISGAPIAET